MKPIRVSIKGFNSFIEEQNIDFIKLTNQGIFGIFGPTGSGKSTVLDAITFALYGKIARETGGHSQYINAKVDTARVVFEFEINTDESNRYKVIREIKRQKNGNVTTSECKIIRNESEVIADKEREVTKAVVNAIGLEYGDFVKTVVLPQGSFNDFLKMEGKERREILERLFNLQKYGQNLENLISSKMKNLEAEKNKIDGLLKGIGEITQESIDNQKKNLENLIEAVKEIEKEKNIQKEKLAKAKEVFDLINELEKIEKEFKVEKLRENEIKIIEEKIEKSRTASTIIPYIEEYQEVVTEGINAKIELKTVSDRYFDIVTEKEKSDMEFEKAESRKNNEKSELLKKAEIYKIFLEHWNEYNFNKKIFSKCLTEQNNIQKIIDEKQSQNIRYKSDSDIFKNKIENIDELIQDCTISHEEINNLTEAVSIFQNIENSSKQIESLEKEISSIGKEIKDLEVIIIETEKNHQKISDKIYESEDKLKTLKETPYSENIKQMKQELEISGEILRREENLIKLNEECKELDFQKENLEKYLQKIESEISDLQNSYNTAIINNSVEVLKHSLHEGDTCPICSNIITEIKSFENITDMEELKKSIDEKSLEKNTIQSEVFKIDKEIAVKNSLAENHEEFLAENKKNIFDLESFRLEIEKMEQEEKFSLSEIEKIEKELAELKSDEKEVGNEILSKSERKKANTELLDKLELQRKNFSGEKLKFEKQLELKYSGEITPSQRLEEINAIQKEKLGLEKQKSDFESKIKEFSKVTEKIDIEINENRIKLAEIKVSKEQAEKQVKTLEHKFLEIFGEVIDPTPILNSTQIQIENIESNFNKAKEKKEKIDGLEREEREKKNILNQNIQMLREKAKLKQEVLCSKLEEKGLANFSELGENEKKIHILDEKIDIVKGQHLKESEYNKNKEIVDEYNGKIAKLKALIDDRNEKLNNRTISETEYFETQTEYEKISEKYKDLNSKADVLSNTISEDEKKLEKIKQVLEDEKKLIKEDDILKQLRSVFSGKKFVEFIAMKHLKYITADATERLSDITNGLYNLEVDSDGSFKIRDNKNGGAIRSIKTLSGGETFVVSLSLALALSAQIQLKGVAPLELFFLDEGFGTLDEALLEVVMESLEKIHNERLKVGIISHVEQLKERMPVKLIVQPAKFGEGGSKVSIEVS